MQKSQPQLTPNHSCCYLNSIGSLKPIVHCLLSGVTRCFSANDLCEKSIPDNLENTNKISIHETHSFASESHNENYHNMKGHAV